MKTIDIIQRAGRSLRHAKVRTILTALAIGVGAFTLTLTIAASKGARVFIDSVIADNFDPSSLIVTADDQVFTSGDSSSPKEYDSSFGSISGGAGADIQVKRLDQDDLEKIRSIPSVESVTEDVSVNALYITGPSDKKYIATLQALSEARSPELLAGSLQSSLKGDEVLLPEEFIKVLGFKTPDSAIGKQITVATRRSVNPETIATQFLNGATNEDLAELSENSIETLTLTVVAVTKKSVTAQPGTELNLNISNKKAVELNNISTKGTSNFQKYVFVNAKIKNGTNKKVLESAQNAIKKAGYNSLSVEDTQKFLLQFINILQGIVVGFAFLAIIASVFGVINTQYISVLERTQQIGLMKALGMRRRDIAWLFRFEAAWIGFLGGTIGAGIAFILGTLLNPWITEKIDLGADNSLLIFELQPIILLVIGLMLVAVTAGILPARKAGKLDPVEALRTE